ncbi:glycosyltransferase [Candidatus Peregrinibacteria bacterium]|nr:glycosyltransferase [Candidatus Peregrinibacteria bacterium]
MKSAIVADWLTNLGGAERVISSFHHILPSAPIYTSLYNPTEVALFGDAVVKSSCLQSLPKFLRRHQFFIKLMPHIFENINLGEYDLVLSSSHACSKGVITKPETLHVCYCHSPMRYVWDDWQEYIRQYGMGKIFSKMLMWNLHNLRLWDRLAADRVDIFVANSQFVAKRIWKYYRRESTVIHPPVDIDRFSSKGAKEGNYFLAVGRLVPYKRFDLLVSAFNENGLKLKICGNGPQYRKLKFQARSNIEFLGNVPEKELPKLNRDCRAFLFPQCEDFGIAPLEAMASGRPVVAYMAGGALETVDPAVSGVFFDQQTVSSLNQALQKISKMKFDQKAIRHHAEKFSISRFEKEMTEFISSSVNNPSRKSK